MLGTQHKTVGLDTQALQLLYRVLCGLCFKLARSREIRNVCKVHAHRSVAKLPFELTDSFKKGQALDIPHCTANFGNHIIEFLLCAATFHLALYLVGDMRNNLNGLAKIVAATLLLNNLTVYSTSGKSVPTSGLDIGKTLIVTEVEVGLVTIDSYITLPVLLRVKRTRRNVYIGVEFLDCNLVASCLQKLAD